jgi:hypothetical protein
LLAEREWIELPGPLPQLPLPVLRELPRGKQPLQRRLGNIILPAHPLALVYLRLELEGGLKAIDYQAQDLVDFAQLLIRLYSNQPHTAHRPAHYGSILLLDMALIVFDPWAPSCEGQLFLFTIGNDLCIEELSATIGVNTEERERE